jgi:hypothetical protein
VRNKRCTTSGGCSKSARHTSTSPLDNDRDDGASDHMDRPILTLGHKKNTEMSKGPHKKLRAAL